MKKAFTIASLAVWALTLLVGIGFAVAGEVTGTNDLPYENQRLRKESQSIGTERESLLEEIVVDRKEHTDRVDRYLTEISRLELQNLMIIESLRSNRSVKSVLGPWPREG